MPQALKVQFDKRQLRAVEAMLKGIRHGWETAASRAINKTGVTVKTRLIKAMSKASGIKQKGVREAVTWRKARRNRLHGEIHITGKRARIRDMAARQTKKGVTYRGQAKKRSLIPSAFIQTLPKTGHRAVYKRTGPERHPIIELFGPSPWYVFVENGELRRKAEADAGTLLHKNFDKQVKLLLDRKAARG